MGAKVPTSRTLVPPAVPRKTLAGLTELLVMLSMLDKLSVSGEARPGSQSEASALNPRPTARREA